MNKAIRILLSFISTILLLSIIVLVFIKYAQYIFIICGVGIIVIIFIKIMCDIYDLFPKTIDSNTNSRKNDYNYIKDWNYFIEKLTDEELITMFKDHNETPPQDLKVWRIEQKNALEMIENIRKIRKDRL